MTVPATTRRAGPFNGNDSSTSFPFTFRVFSKDDIQVQFANATGVSSVLVLDSDYSVTLNVDQDATPGGSITYPISGDPLAAGEKLVILGAVPYEQTTDLPAGGAYRASVVEDALDRTVMQVQQLSEELGRALTLPAAAAGANTALPVPVANNFIGWNDTASALRNVDPSTAASIVAYANRRTLVADGGLSNYTLTTDPGNASNTMVAVAGVVQTPGVDYTVSGTTLTPTTPWPVGAGNVTIVYGEALPVGTQTADNVNFTADAVGAVQRTVQAKLRDAVSVLDFGAVGDGVTDDSAAIQAAEDACAADGRSLYWPAGTYRCNTGVVKKAVDWLGDGKYKSVLMYYGSGTFINATGTSSARVICTIANMGFDGVYAAANAVGFTFGWNQRATPLLVGVHIRRFGHYGIHFNDENWIVSFYDVEVDTCGTRTADSSGVYKSPSIDAGTWNAISFYNLTVEACGSASSTAGGIRIETTSANRGVYFYSPCVEGNWGVSEILITNLADCQFFGLYMETLSSQATNAVELRGVTGGFTGGYITGDNIAVNLAGVRVRAGGAFVPNEVSFDKITILNFASSVDAQDAKVWTNLVHGNRTFANTANTAQYFGDHAPRVGATKNASQSVPSGAFTKVTFETEAFDLGGRFSSSTWTPCAVGLYQVDAQVTWDAAADQDALIVSVYKRGTAYRSFVHRASGTGSQSVRISTLVDTDLITDTIELYVRQTSGSAKTISPSAAETWFTGQLMGRAA